MSEQPLSTAADSHECKSGESLGITTRPANHTSELLSTLEPAEVANPWQFSLLGLFELITVAAVVAGLTKYFGSNELAPFIGLSFAYFNSRGIFARIETPKIRSRVTFLSWIVFGFSVLYPDDSIQNRAAVLTFQPIESVSELLALTLLDSVILLTVMLPLILWRVRKGKWQLLTGLNTLLYFTVWNVQSLYSDAGILGSWLWGASVTLLMFTKRVSRDTFYLMIWLELVLFLFKFYPRF